MSAPQFIPWNGQSGPGVYALKRRGKIVYIGHAQWMRERIAAHSSNIKFETVDFVLIHSRAKRLQAEKDLIREHQPELNIRRMNGEAIKQPLVCVPVLLESWVVEELKAFGRDPKHFLRPKARTVAARLLTEWAKQQTEANL